jgi:uncharacterized membrane protein
MSGFDFSRYINQIKNAKTPDELAALRFDSPGYIDRKYLGASDNDILSLEKMKQAQMGNLALPEVAALKSAYPNMVDYTQATGTTDPRFWNDPESRKVLALDGVTGDIGPFAATPTNIATQAAQQEYGDKARSEAGLRDYIKGDASPNVLAQLANSDETKQHMTAVRNMATDYQARGGIAPTLEEKKFALTQDADKANREAYRNMDYLTRENTPEGVMNASAELADVTGASPDFITKDMQAPALKQFETVKDSVPHTIDKPMGNGLIQKFQYDPKSPEADKFVIPIGKPFKPTSQQALEIRQHNVNENALSPEGNTALIQAIAEKRLDPYKVNSRNQKVLAEAALRNPGINLNNIAAEMGVARNKDIIMKAGVAEMIPDLLKTTAAAGKALNYSDAQFIGNIQKWSKGQLNDPKLTRYMTLRNDQLLTIGGVMRSNGMTDMAQRLEEEAARPTLSPKALDGWLEGQLESIDPRLNFYRSITKGNTAIPRSSYNPGDHGKAPIAPAGTRVAKKGGGYYTSDGKGGWR